MPFREYDLYHGAALNQIVKDERFASVNKYPEASQSEYIINHDIGLYLKYRSNDSSPWQFTFNHEQHQQLRRLVQRCSKTYLGFICGTDGCCCVPYQTFVTLIPEGTLAEGTSLNIEVSRDPGGSYRVHRGYKKFSVPVNAFPRILFE
ncbi:hypothetical protein Btus_2952 [Kyrpidia tusciae DSM 2912]|uniref:Uncharacterized protein n=1 Tax=Kyrpidia tusciae (strain DSM 2912 / NBRC 15312 / T2) TaxID=562970 RepID=D5WVP0_KYRT2|nr:hypothetical protein Btus_2952 [Kyrpidia tusciae DSM 2912]